MQTPSPGATDQAARRLLLPHPLHLFQRLTASDHYHFGRFRAGSTNGSGAPSLRDAMDELVLAALPRDGTGLRALDVGSGMGGSAQLLARRGYEVVALEPDEALVRYARGATPVPGAPRQPSFVHGRLGATSTASLGGPFDLVVMIEVQQHFETAEACLRAATAALRTGGDLLLLDLSLTSAAGAAGGPFFPCGAIARAAEAAGLTVVHDRDLTVEVRPTLGLLAAALDAARLEAHAYGRQGDPALGGQLQELATQVAALDAAIDAGHLCYHETRLHRGQGA